ncbi:BTB/POZ domain-containing protein 6-like [Haliotis rufescens]|uniref:BTB/POZ domain-containing protein 6-like n=1 Tax=Haliotis rufescens TaxID=6454 RepID=UPI001EAFE0EE|nr:BTB/POZ domain-containing protein 6-like [Haliotis rufescens]
MHIVIRFTTRMAASSVQPTGFVDNWQAGKTLAQCNRRMLDAEDSCDVTFRVGSTGHMIKAHRYVLISRSCVFHAMFTGPLAEKSDVSIPEIEHKDFKQFVLYLYTDTTHIDADNVTALLYASRKYATTTLESQCLEFLENNLSVENACVVLEAAHHYDQSHLYKEALTLVKSEGDKSLQSLGFLALSHVLVDQIVELDDLVAGEHVIFNAVNSWAEAECGRQAREVTPQAKRSILGETVMKVRYPLLEPSFLAGEVKSSGLLSDSERLKIFDYRANSDNDVKPFKTNLRTKCIKLPVQYAYRYMYNEGHWGCSGGTDAISFRTSKNVTLIGYQLYGPYTTSNDDYTVTSYFGNEDAVLNSKIQDAKVYRADDETFDVLLEKPVTVSAGQWYTLAVVIQGQITSHGRAGREEVYCNVGRVTFDFRTSKHSTNGTDVSHGQIPSLIYRPT